jgi:hypothetical protein
MIIPKHFIVQPACVKNNKGYITLISVLIIGAMGVAVAVSLIGIGISSSQTVSALERANQAKALANACAEEAIQQIRDSTAFSGNGSLALGRGNCSYEVVNNGGQNRQINISANVDKAARNIEINVDQINPQINIASWQELSDF